MAKNKKIEPLKEFITISRVFVIDHTPRQQDELFKFTNLHHLGIEDCNRRNPKTGAIEPIDELKETPELKEAHWRIGAGREIVLNITYDKNLNLISITR